MKTYQKITTFISLLEINKQKEKIYEGEIGRVYALKLNLGTLSPMFFVFMLDNSCVFYSEYTDTLSTKHMLFGRGHLETLE